MTLFTRYGLIGVLIVAICLGGINAVLTYRLDKANDANQVLSDANKKLNDAIADRDETITALKESIDADRRATEEQLKIEQQKRAKSDAENRTLRKALESSDAGNQPLPDDVKRILRRETKDPSSPQANLRLPARGIATAV
jgi:predicted RNase H-like nuclease (RuvC/YqgF family)